LSDLGIFRYTLQSLQVGSFPKARLASDSIHPLAVPRESRSRRFGSPRLIGEILSRHVPTSQSVSRDIPIVSGRARSSTLSSEGPLRLGAPCLLQCSGFLQFCFFSPAFLHDFASLSFPKRAVRRVWKCAPSFTSEPQLSPFPLPLLLFFHPSSLVRETSFFFLNA